MMPLDPEHSLVSLFDRLCFSFGDETAVTDEAAELGFSELKEASIVIAHQLAFRHGLTAGDRVLVACAAAPCAEAAAILACARLGAPYVPVDPTWLMRGDRLEHVVLSSRARAAVVCGSSDEDTVVRALASFGVHRSVLVSRDATVLEAMALADRALPQPPAPRDSVGSDRPLYVLHTSGSSSANTVGVVGTHAGLLRRVAWQQRRFPFSAGEVVLRRTPLVFVDGATEVFGALLSGVGLWCPPLSLRSSGGIAAYAEAANEAGVTRATMLPSQLSTALALDPALGRRWPRLRLVFVSGEQSFPSLLRAFSSACPRASLINMWGTTEVAGDATYAVLVEKGCATTHGASDEDVPIGRELDGFAQVCVMKPVDAPDPNSESASSPVPVGEVGELCVGGDGVALGYDGVGRASDGFRSQASTPFTGVERRWFRTGDLGVLGHDGMFRWRGRLDNLVKVNGVRVSLEEAERLLSAALVGSLNTRGAGMTQRGSAGVQLVVLPTRFGRNPDSPLRLVCFVQSPSMQNGGTMLARIREKLPSHMVPAVLLLKSSLPKLSSGKVDRRSLTNELDDMVSQQPQDTLQNTPIALEHGGSGTGRNGGQIFGYQGVRSLLLRLFSEILPPALVLSAGTNATKPKTSVAGDGETGDSYSRGSFLELGGDSMLSISLMWRIKQLCGVRLTLDDLALDFERLVLRVVHEQETTSGDSVNGLKCAPHGGVPSTVGASLRSPLNEVRGRKIMYESKQSSAAKRARRTAVDAGEVKWVGKAGAGSLNFAAAFGSSDTDKYDSSCKLHGAWSHRLLKCIDATPLVVVAKTPGSHEDTVTVLVGSHGGDFVRLSLKCGKVIWSTLLEGRVEASAACNADCSLVFVPTYSATEIGESDTKDSEKNADGERGRLYALRGSSGDIVWCRTFPCELKSTPLVSAHDGVVLIGGYDACLYGVCPQTGNLLMRHTVAPLVIGAAIYASPVELVVPSQDCLLHAPNSELLRANLRSGLIFVCTTAGGKICALTRSNEARIGDTNAMDEMWAFSTEDRSPIFATPCILTETSRARIFVAFVDGCVRCLDALSGSMLWICAPEGRRPIFSSPCLVSTVYSHHASHRRPLDEDRREHRFETLFTALVYGSHDGILRKLNVDNGAVEWSAHLDGTAIFASPGILNPRTHEVVVATVGGGLFTVEMASGAVNRQAVVPSEELSKHNGGRDRFPAEVFSSPVSFGGFVVVGCRDDMLWTFGSR